MTDAPADGAEQSDASLDPHVEESVEVLRKFRRDHEGAKSKFERLIDRLVQLIGSPGSAGILILLVCLWIGGNLLATHLGLQPLDAPPFAWLELFATVFAMILAVVILSTQSREDRLAERRADLTLELSLISEKKSAKIIALLEELRRDSPNVADRHDAESAEMSKVADPETVLAAIQKSGRSAD